MDFSQVVKMARNKIGLSQEELARTLNVSFATVNRWENGKTIPNKLTQEVFFEFCKKQKIFNNDKNYEFYKKIHQCSSTDNEIM